jgi:hypothetical protein
VLIERAYQAICLVVLLVAGQQGAVLHELGHLTGAQQPTRTVESPQPSDPVCALCSEFAQVSSPTFAYSFDLPPIAPTASVALSAPQITSVDAPVPTARSRGPPSLS